MNQKTMQIPKPVGQALSMLPAYPGSLMFVAGLNLALNQRVPEDVQQTLVGKRLRIRVQDAMVTFDFAWKQGGFAAEVNAGEADLTISATAHDFLLLAQRKEDPDTLFFSRRLLMEGDTELGLLVKNTLDAVDLSTFDLAAMAPGQVLARLRSQFGFKV